MLGRFRLYGLLKNQRYFEAFIVLAFVQRGLSFSEIGLLVALRELTTNVLEVPSGVVADLLGRRRCMVTAFGAYVAAYLLLGLLTSLPAMALGLVLIGFGDAFRSGTHKAMIFDWLSAQGRQDERVEIYGSTRAWSQMGSALAVPLAAVVVVWRGGYDEVFLLSAVPAALNLINLATYPGALEGPRRSESSMRETARSLWQAARSLWPRRSLRVLLLEAAGFSGLYRAMKDYLQPLLEAAALALPVVLIHDDTGRSALMVGLVYGLLFGLSALASRRAHRVVARAGGIDRGARWIRIVVALVFGLMLAGTLLGWVALTIAAFVLLALVHNLFRPVLVARFDAEAPAELGATVLSVESQATSLGAVLVAPVLGLAVDLASTADAVQLWPVAAVGLFVSLLVVWRASAGRYSNTNAAIPG